MAMVMVAPRARLESGARILVEVDGLEIGVFAHDGEVFAFENRCAHQGGPVCEGLVLGRVGRVLDDEGLDRGGLFADDEPHLICPWHGWEFDLASGRSVAYPELGLRRFETIERDGDVYLAV